MMPTPSKYTRFLQNQSHLIQIDIPDDVGNTSGMFYDNWTTAAATFWFCFNAKTDCNFYIDYTPLPQQVLDSLKQLNVNIFVGEILIHTEIISKSEHGTINFKVPFNYLKNNFKHAIRLEVDTWIPNDVLGSDDYRSLGIGIVKVYVDEKNIKLEISDKDHVSIHTPLVGALQPTLINNFDEYDEFIENYLHTNFNDESSQIDFLNSYALNFHEFTKLYGTTQRSNDPFSEEYANWELSFFQFLSGKDYNYLDEGLIFDVSNEMKKPPTVDWDIEHRIKANRQYMEILSYIRPKRSDCVLVMGFGWGTILEQFGRCGCRVVGLDASISFIKLAHHQLTSQNINFQPIHGSFYDAELLEDSVVDLIVFEASFHHCGEPLRLLSILNKKMSSGGRIFFINEPILQNADRPWGVIRYEGTSIFEIRHRGWMELGFRLDFFERLLTRTGFKLTSIFPMENGNSLYMATKI